MTAIISLRQTTADTIPPHPGCESEIDAHKHLAAFKARWFPVKELRPAHKDKLKWAKSIEQGRDGTEVMCERCKTVFGLRQLTIHHINHDTTDNRLENIKIFCSDCNITEHQEWLRNRSSPHHTPAPSHTMGERENNAHTLTQAHEYAPASAQETERHAEMRPHWDKFIADRDRGAFAVKPVWKQSDLAEYAVHALIRPDGTKGSSVTYRRYIREDIAGGRLAIEYDEYGKPVIAPPPDGLPPVRYIPKDAFVRRYDKQGNLVQEPAYLLKEESAA